MRPCILQGQALSPAPARFFGSSTALARPMQSAWRMDTDFTALLIAFGFFAASWGFVALCERLRS